MIFLYLTNFSKLESKVFKQIFLGHSIMEYAYGNIITIINSDLFDMKEVDFK
jgi:hypothetical protein